ncbi:hypothetical protein [Actinomadura sp. CNU-125]|uniref:hypothetical protein n=1 Tax=Actinomadura sp. CNU-125 TaxID=1904961 RepID=UPI001178528B|nr:hypothetical protein [Actinomadura sp. CNU-125]
MTAPWTPERVAAEVQRRYPGTCAWLGRHTGSWWAVARDRTGRHRLVEGATPAELVHRLDELGVRRAGYAPQPSARPRPSGPPSPPPPPPPRPVRPRPPAPVAASAVAPDRRPRVRRRPARLRRGLAARRVRRPRHPLNRARGGHLPSAAPPPLRRRCT